MPEICNLPSSTFPNWRAKRRFCSGYKRYGQGYDAVRTLRILKKTNNKNRKMNNFYTDSHALFKDLSRKIVDKKIVTDMDFIQSTLLFALGIEKLLKGILFDINPIFILENSDFKNAFAVYHKDKLIKANENTKDIQQEPNGDVIAFQNSVLRSALVSQTAFDYKNTLFKIKNARDIIVHHSFNKLDIAELKLFINRDFYLILKAFSDELNWGELHCFDNLHSPLALISSSLQDDIDKKVKLKLESTKAKWKVTKGQNLRKNKKLAVEMLQDEFAYPTICPSCENIAVVFTKPIYDFNPYLKQEIQVGLQTLKLDCSFCTLKIDDYKELDFLKIVPDPENKVSTINEYSEEICIDSNDRPSAI